MKNVILAQKMIRDINKRNRLVNVVVKLDMSWVILTKVMRKFGFLEVLIKMIWWLLSNNWY